MNMISPLARARSAGKMQDDEVEAQLMLVISLHLRTCSPWCDFPSHPRTLIIAGHETSGTSLTWLLYELAVHSEHQSIIRAELNHSNEYDSMPYLNAVIKVSTVCNIACSRSPLVKGVYSSASSRTFLDAYGSSRWHSTSLRREDAYYTKGANTTLLCLPIQPARSSRVTSM